MCRITPVLSKVEGLRSSDLQNYGASAASRLALETLPLGKVMVP